MLMHSTVCSCQVCRDKKQREKRGRGEGSGLGAAVPGEDGAAEHVGGRA